MSDRETMGAMGQAHGELYVAWQSALDEMTRLQEACGKLQSELSSARATIAALKEAHDALWALWNDKAWCGYKANYLRGHLSYAGMLESKEAPIRRARALLKGDE